MDANTCDSALSPKPGPDVLQSPRVALVEDIESGSHVVVNVSTTVPASETISRNADNPLNWPMWIKVAVLIQTSLLAAIGGLNTATINPALLQLAREFHVSRVRASYQTTVCIALNGIAPWLWIPLAQRYGRRPIWLITTLLAFVSILGCAYAKTYNQLIVARIFNGLFPVGFALGATTVVDLFETHQRGRAMGFFTVTVVNGSHLAPIIGGLLGQYCGWRWIFKFLAIVDAVLLMTAVFCLPETMYVETEASQITHSSLITTNTHQPLLRTNNERDNNLSLVAKPGVDVALTRALSPSSADDITKSTVQQYGQLTSFQRYLHSMRLYTLNSSYAISFHNSILPTLRLFLRPRAVFPAIYYASMYGFASILPAVTVAAIFTEFFGWNTLTIGLSYGAALTIGGVLGEGVSGWVCDACYKYKLADQRWRDPDYPWNPDVTVDVSPGVRLWPIWPGAILTPIGMLVYGFTLHYHAHPAAPLFGMSLSCFGLQIITTCTYTYAIDTFTPRANHAAPSSTAQPPPPNTHESPSPPPHPSAADVAQLFNFIRQTFGFTFAFYVVHLGEKIGYHLTFLIFAICGGVLAFLPILGLMGAEWFMDHGFCATDRIAARQKKVDFTICRVTGAKLEECRMGDGCACREQTKRWEERREQRRAFVRMVEDARAAGVGASAGADSAGDVGTSSNQNSAQEITNGSWRVGENIK